MVGGNRFQILLCSMKTNVSIRRNPRDPNGVPLGIDGCRNGMQRVVFDGKVAPVPKQHPSREQLLSHDFFLKV
jgi:hypothetical protein